MMEANQTANTVLTETLPVSPKSSWISILKPGEVGFKLEILLILLTLIFLRRLSKRNKPRKKDLPFPTVQHTRLKLPDIVEGCLTLVKIRWEGFKAFDSWMEKYGKIFELPFFNEKVVCLTNPSTIHKVMSSTDPGQLNKPRFLYDKVFVENLRNGMTSSDYPLWFGHRKMISRAFTYKALRTYLNFMNDHAKALTGNLLKECTIARDGNQSIGGVQMFDLVYFHSLKIILQVLMGADTSCSDKDSIFFHDHFRRAKEIVVYRFLHSELMLDTIWWFHPKRREFQKIFKLLYGFISEKTEKFKEKWEIEKSQGGSGPQDDEGEDEDPLGNDQDEDTDIGVRPFRCLIEEMLRHDAKTEEIFDEICIFIAAGHETMTVAINLFMWHLACNPEHQERCREEIDAILDPKSALNSDDASFTMEDLYNLKHMERCILEAFRMTPTIPLFAKRIDTPLTADGMEFESGTNFLLVPSVVHMNPEYFPDPHKFDPDRFLPESVKERAPCAYYPFSFGPRNCIGNKLSIAQIKIIVGWILRNFEIHTTDKWEDMNWMYEITIVPHKPFNVTLKERVR